jgi:hypothetical protein
MVKTKHLALKLAKNELILGARGAGSMPKIPPEIAERCGIGYCPHEFRDREKSD